MRLDLTSSGSLSPGQASAARDAQTTWTWPKAVASAADHWHRATPDESVEPVADRRALTARAGSRRRLWRSSGITRPRHGHLLHWPHPPRSDQQGGTAPPGGPGDPSRCWRPPCALRLTRPAKPA